MNVATTAPVRRLQWYAFLATGPVLWIALNYTLFPETAFREPGIWLLSIFTIGLPGLGIWYCYGRLSWYLKRSLPAPRQIGLRLSLQIASLLLLAAGFTLLIFIGYDRAGFFGYHWQSDQVRQGLLVTLGLCVLVENLYEADYTRLRYQESREDLRRLELAAEQQEFAALKNAVNPHFLFNCFNTLSSLISEDPPRANRFLGELSKVYRYLLLNNRETLTTLADEIDFIRSYCQLLKTRYGNALEVNIDLHPHYAGYLIPSLSLQLLVENAVKHNIVATDQPLTIDIFTIENNQLIVNNNRQSKAVRAVSTRIGLENIRMKYQLLQQAGFQVIEDERNFTVALPLVKPR